MQKLDSKDILPCPCCTGIAVYFHSHPRTVGHGESEDSIGINCIKCKLTISINDYADRNVDGRLTKVLARWNTRPDKLVTLSPWLVYDEYCAVRIVEGGDVTNVADRVAFIEKTPRVRTGAYHSDSYKEQDNWTQGPKGQGGCHGENPANELYGFYPPSREWCDAELVKMGYVLGD